MDDVYYIREYQEYPVGVFGQLFFQTEEGEKRSVKFKTLVFLENRKMGTGASTPPSHSYDIFLHAGETGEQRLPISQSLKPGEVDHFVTIIKEIVVWEKNVYLERCGREALK